MAKGIKLRNWALDAQDFENEDQFRAAVELELARFEHIGERFGVALVAAPVKQVIGSEYVTVGWTFQTATIPAARQVEPDPEPLTEEDHRDLDEAEEEEAVAAITDDPYAETE